MLRIEDIDRLEIVSSASVLVGDLQDFAVRPGLRERLLNPRSRGFVTIGERPLVVGNARLTPRLQPIQNRRFSHLYHSVWPRDGDQVRLVLPLVAFPQERI